MRIGPEMSPYLCGEAFSSGLRMVISDPGEPVLDRLAILERLAKGKNVVHLGCADHVPLIEAKRSRGQWLHERLCNVSRRCLGIDIDPDGIRFLRERLGFKDVVCANLLEDEVPEVSLEKWDVVVAGELIEHMDEPVRFLSGVRRVCLDRVQTLVATVPNALCWTNTRMATQHAEYINSDHRYWFTPYTLAKVASRAGLKPTSFQFCRSCPPQAPSFGDYVRLGRALDYHMMRRYPALRETIVMECEF